MAKIAFEQPVGKSLEKWLPLPVAGVWVSTLGRVWNGIPRIGQRGIVKTSESRGYLLVRVPGINGGKSIGVHRLVAHAFIGECPDGMCVDHIDCDPQNNRPENLQYVTPSENTRLYWERRRAADPVMWEHARKTRESDRFIRRAIEEHEERVRLLDEAEARRMERERLALS